MTERPAETSSAFDKIGELVCADQVARVLILGDEAYDCNGCLALVSNVHKSSCRGELGCRREWLMDVKRVLPMKQVCLQHSLLEWLGLQSTSMQQERALDKNFYFCRIVLFLQALDETSRYRISFMQHKAHYRAASCLKSPAIDQHWAGWSGGLSGVRMMQKAGCYFKIHICRQPFMGKNLRLEYMQQDKLLRNTSLCIPQSCLMLCCMHCHGMWLCHIKNGYVQLTGLKLGSTDPRYGRAPLTKPVRTPSVGKGWKFW